MASEGGRVKSADGDMGKSLDINVARFSIDRQLMMILRNTADLLGLNPCT